MMMSSPEDMQKWSGDQCDEGITALNNYRRTGQSILNNYNQQVSLIEQGKTPYAILFPEKKWLTLAERMERAQRLRQATRDWNMDIDKKAIQVRQICGGKQREDGSQWDLDSVDALWEQDGVETRPYFKDPKQKRDVDGFTKDLRVTRDGKRIMDKYLNMAGLRQVAPEEVRGDEEQALPGGVRRLASREERDEEAWRESQGIHRNILNLSGIPLTGPLATEEDAEGLPENIRVLRNKRLDAWMERAHERAGQEGVVRTRAKDGWYNYDWLNMPSILHEDRNMGRGENTLTGAFPFRTMNKIEDSSNLGNHIDIAPETQEDLDAMIEQQRQQDISEQQQLENVSQQKYNKPYDDLDEDELDELLDAFYQVDDDLGEYRDTTEDPEPEAPREETAGERRKREREEAREGERARARDIMSRRADPSFVAYSEARQDALNNIAATLSDSEQDERRNQLEQRRRELTSAANAASAEGDAQRESQLREEAISVADDIRKIDTGGTKGAQSILFDERVDAINRVLRKPSGTMYDELSQAEKTRVDRTIATKYAPDEPEKEEKPREPRRRRESTRSKKVSGKSLTSNDTSIDISSGSISSEESNAINSVKTLQDMFGLNALQVMEVVGDGDNAHYAEVRKEGMVPFNEFSGEVMDVALRQSSVRESLFAVGVADAMFGRKQTREMQDIMLYNGRAFGLGSQQAFPSGDNVLFSNMENYPVMPQWSGVPQREIMGHINNFVDNFVDNNIAPRMEDLSAMNISFAEGMDNPDNLKTSLKQYLMMMAAGQGTRSTFEEPTIDEPTVEDDDNMYDDDFDFDEIDDDIDDEFTDFDEGTDDDDDWMQAN